MPLQIAQQRPSRSNKLALELDTTAHKKSRHGDDLRGAFLSNRVDGVKPPRDAASAQVQEIGLVVLENEAAPRARGAPSPRPFLWSF